MAKIEKSFQGSLFEEDYLIRTLGNLGTSPEVALTELVANAWDAGATEVEIYIPESLGGKLSIEDNGVGLTKEEFYKRWMKLGYNRLKHQGKKVEFPPGVNLQRYAYGRNGVGRHGMLCFNSEYQVTTTRNGGQSTFIITTKSEDQPFLIAGEKFKRSGKHGTRLEVIIERNLPNTLNILEVISSRFLHDPNFTIIINRKTIELENLRGLVRSEKIEVNGIKLIIHLVDSQKSRKSAIYQGIAFWQGSKLVGEPSWVIGYHTVLDGRTKEAKRYSVVVRTNDLADYIREDWTGFKKEKENALEPIFKQIDEVVQGMFLTIAKENIQETTKQIKEDYRVQYNELTPLAKYELNAAIENIATSNPTASEESIALAIETVINLEKTRSGSALLQKLTKFSQEDVAGLNQLLENWTIKDALTVLDEIDNRISVVEAIRKLASDSTVDELHILHPLIASARWIFGPEFDSPEYSSNSQLQTTVEKVFGKKIDRSAFNNSNKRPDLVSLRTSTVSITGTTAFENELTTTNKVLLIELKKGGFRLGREERNQTAGYVEDFMNCGTIIGNPYITAFLVGESFKETIQPTHLIKNKNDVEMGKVQVCLFSQLVDSAEKRLFNLRARLSERYSEYTGVELVSKQMKMVI
ncbi:MAG: ATP-binding protein [Chitinophagaceae bacterium]